MEQRKRVGEGVAKSDGDQVDEDKTGMGAAMAASDNGWKAGDEIRAAKEGCIR